MLSAEDNKKKIVLRHGYRLLLLDQLGICGRTLPLSLKKFGCNFTFISNHVTDFSLLSDILITEEYQQTAALNNPSIIVDLGSNIGVSVIYFRLLYPEADIFAYEPSVSCFKRLKENVRSYKKIHLYNKAVGDLDREVIFYENLKRSLSSSLIKRNASARKVIVNQSSLDTIFSHHSFKKVDLLKFDIEGAEFDLFKNSSNINIVSTYIGELHNDLIQYSIDKFCNLFEGFEIELESIGPHRLLFFARKLEERI